MEWWPSLTVRGSLGPQAEGLRVEGWYEQNRKAGTWVYCRRDGGLDRIEVQPVPRAHPPSPRFVLGPGDCVKKPEREPSSTLGCSAAPSAWPR